MFAFHLLTVLHKVCASLSEFHLSYYGSHTFSGSQASCRVKCGWNQTYDFIYDASCAENPYRMLEGYHYDSHRGGYVFARICPSIS